MIAGATSATYTPVDDDVDDDAPLKSDVGRYLLAVVSYTDAKRNVETDDGEDVFNEERPGTGPGWSSVNPVAEDTRNRAPEFERHRISDTPGTQNQTADERGGGEQPRAWWVTRSLPRTQTPTRTRWCTALSGVDAALFSVGAVQSDYCRPCDEGGQITVKSTTKLDFETRTTYMVTITATDSFGESASIDVTITVTDVDEARRLARAAWR